eukprot:9181915-Alexandrium_andersonii.AAC.1
MARSADAGPTVQADRSTAVGADLRSWALGTNPTPSAAPWATPVNLASPELAAMVFLTEDQCLMVRRPHAATSPKVERRAVKRPAKS